MSMTSVYVNRTDGGHDLAASLRGALEWLGWERIVARGSRVFLKPNLTWRLPSPGVTTTPKFLEAAVEILRERAGEIIIGESDGGYHAFKAEEAF